MDDSAPSPSKTLTGGWKCFPLVEILLLVLVMFVYAGDGPPMVNEAHYLVKAKNFWQPEWCQQDLFAASDKAHTTFYWVFGWPTQYVSLEATAWLGRVVGWAMLAVGLQQLCCAAFARPGFSPIVLVVWIAGIEYGNLAGEWVIGGIEAKVPAYGLILLGLAEMVRGRWSRVWILLGGASAFHVLSGGWSVVAAMFAWALMRIGSKRATPLGWKGLVAGGAISLLGLVPALALTAGSDPEDARVAARIYSYYRIRHHLLPADFYAHWYLRHATLLGATACLAWRYRHRDERLRVISAFTLGALVIAAVGLVVGLLPAVEPDVAARLLRFYWFRLSDAAVPLLAALLVARMILDARELIPHRITYRQAGLALALIATVMSGASAFERMWTGVPPSVSNELLGWDRDAPPSVQRKVMEDWLRVCRWAKLSTPPDEVFLTPRHQQTFKWYAHRAEVVNWKDVPQDATALREWYARFHEVFPQRLGHVRVTIQYSVLREYRQRYGVRQMIVDQRVTGDRLPLVKVYPVGDEVNETYAVYELPR